jgi:hypothetical protein
MEEHSSYLGREKLIIQRGFFRKEGFDMVWIAEAA